ncbi:hypothetical protein BU25DRAFT_420327 [Macroventuria anomochaeta]|uniref:Uncharacterized protein n=1 Tax=Macroventuria anomochaeta TaxID=301207 RepID=A0ACB6S685_9PLEO|nr:uncharacterized protein BU25DRAFT_420327 [Macroventuria anomochaeta]KAF2628868.1 hypothetical protein BU25DRAFT_420327 [Macroventuria anomochaeta]
MQLHHNQQRHKFLSQGGLQKYFIVDLADVKNPENARVGDWVQAQLAEYKLTQQEVEEKLQTLEEAAKTDKTGWFKRTGWLDFFNGRNLVHLAHQTRTPDHGEDKIELAAELIERLVERSVKELATLPQETRRWLQSAKQSEIDSRPIGRLQNPEKQQVTWFRQQQAAVAGSESQEATSGEEDSEDDEEGSEADSDAPQPRRRSRRHSPLDQMEAVRELFAWTEDQKSCAI